ncbi:MAG TPA: HAD-IIIA family hydrolase [Abditibacteriaceae bacterium]|nr:HAD-IIIA family hydrolase [Abditibacteriaceae bacterium]
MQKRQAVFLDLQGTLGGDGLGHILDFSFFPFVAPALQILNGADWLVIIVTNQSHIAKGKLTHGQYEEKIKMLRDELAEQGARVDAVYCCPHSAADGCSCKKPLPGMLLQARQDFNLDLAKCYVVGDIGANDMVLAQAVGAKGVLVLTGVGKGSLHEYRKEWAHIEPDFVAADVLEAAQWIVEHQAD